MSAFHGLSNDRAIGYDNLEIYSAGLNIHDRPDVEKYIPDISAELYAQLRASGIKYDAITSCPRGGDAWAQALIDYAKADGHDVPFYRLNKVATQCFSIIDGQPVPKKAKLIVVDDTIFRGYTSSAAVEVLENAGFKVTGLVFPVEIGLEGWRKWKKRKCPVISIYNNSFIQSLSK